MSYQQIMHVVGVLLFLHQNALHHHTCCRILVGEETYQFTIVIAGNPLGNKIFFNHFDEGWRLRCIAKLIASPIPPD